MKNLLFIIAAMLLLVVMACEKEGNVEEAADVQQEIDSRTPPEFAEICHKKPDGTFVAMTVPVNALPQHISHGDKYADHDYDGYSALDACSGTKNDCDDNNAAVYPGATEICDGFDNNCDGKTDAPEDFYTEGAQWYFEDFDGDGHGSMGAGNKFCEQPVGWVSNISDCNDEDSTIYIGALDIPNDGIDQDCSGTDSINVVVYPPCSCFTMEELQEVYNYTPWPYGWWSDVPGSCKDAPYDQLMEVWITNVGQPAQNFNFSVQAGTINGNPFASQARFNHLTGQFDELCGGYTTAENASNCALILKAFIQQMKASHPSWDYCVRFP